MTNFARGYVPAAAVRGRAVALARSDLPLYLAMMGLLVLLWAGMFFAIGMTGMAGDLGAGEAGRKAAQVACENQHTRAPGELLRCKLPEARRHPIDI